MSGWSLYAVYFIGGAVVGAGVQTLVHIAVLRRTRR
jgi:hypothetical protein